ncbi:hypothetical protein [Myroides sp. LoEW2-1]|uniref:hypothetical protein n=1 Tax=Myroides sp. LoEW2-1 TaxID=2683192 RepID=UPI001329183C|nr:hypothetical protein [Myroides sp. LoEW2-1]MVX36581.1 hypothetical protein [Myroides sp. LoEW2-1]
MNTRSLQYQLLVNYAVARQNLDYFKAPIANGLLSTDLSNDARDVTYTYQMAGSDRLLVSKDFISNVINQVIFIIMPELTNGNVTFNTYSNLINYLNKSYPIIQVSKSWEKGIMSINMHLQDDGIAILIISYI